MMKFLHVCALLLVLPLVFGGCGLVVIETVTETADTREKPLPRETSAPVEITIPPKAENGYASLAEGYLAQVAAGNYDFDGYTFFIATPRATSLLPLDEDTYSLKKMARNQAVEEALNVVLATLDVTEKEYVAAVTDSVLADEYYSDLLLIPQAQIGEFVTQGLLANLRSMPLLDLTRPYFYSSSVSAATHGNKIYAVAGYASFEETTLNAVYFNRSVLEKYNMTLPYDLVNNGTWTWDKFFEYTDAIAEINEPDTLSSYSYQYSTNMLPSAVFFSCGGKYVDSTDDYYPTLTLSENDTYRVNIIARLLDDDYSYPAGDDGEGLSRFHTGQSLFMLDRLFIFSWMANSNLNWGLLPFPKYDEYQTEYLSLVSDEALFFAVQKNTVEGRKAAVVLSALNASSYGVINEAYVSYHMNHTLRDNDSANMLEMILFSPTYDYAFSFGATMPALAAATYDGMNTLFTNGTLAKILAKIPAAQKILSQ